MRVSETSLNNVHCSFHKETSLNNDSGRSRKSLIKKTDAMADKAMSQLQIPDTFRKSVLWLAWNRSEAKFWEMVEAAMASKVRSPGRYFIASISQERYARR